MLSQKHRADIAAWANVVGLKSRRSGAPSLSADSSRETLLRWLQWNDPDGAYTDDARESDASIDGPPNTLEEAWEMLDQQYDWDGVQGTEAARVS